MAHLTAVGHSVAELRHVVGRLAGAGVRNVLALRGDPPGDPLGDVGAAPAGPASTPRSWSRLVKAHGDFCVGVAAFPEKHPRSPDLDSDARYFVAKCRAGADFAITQMFFRAEDYLRHARPGRGARLRRADHRRHHADHQRARQSSGPPSCPGAAFPAELAAELHAVEDDPAAVRRVGVEHRDRAVRAAARRGRAGPALLHAEPVDGDPRGLRGARPRRPPGPRLR